MCGIISYCGKSNAIPVLLEGLSKLEYRGYDSAGIALSSHDHQIRTIKATGKVKDLEHKIQSFSFSESHCGIGHTRWATHGEVTETNAHPHTCGSVTLIHNGIIENYTEIAEKLAAYDKFPISQTDTEIAAMWISHNYDGDPIATIKRSCADLEGAYAFCILFADHPFEIYCIRNASPLVAVHTNDGAYIASDMTALIDYSKDYFIVPEHHIAKLTEDGIDLLTLDGTPVAPEMLHATWDAQHAKKNGYAHFMLKEIHEQPDALFTTIMPRITDSDISFADDQIPDSVFTNCSNIVITACGTAMHAGIVGKFLFESLLRIPVTVEAASEFRYNDPIIDEHTLVILISQSGETADTLAALRLAKEKGSKTLSIVNVKGSSIALESDYVLYTHAGPEISVASTKAFTVQMAALYLICGKIGMIRHQLQGEQKVAFFHALSQLPTTIKETLQLEDHIKEISHTLTDVQDTFFIGRGLDYALACEGSLKLKEVSYIHSEAYVAGELKHGSIALITDKVPVIAIATKEEMFPKMLSNIREVKARGSNIILITTSNMAHNTEVADHVIVLPKTEPLFTPFTVSIAVQLLAYYVSVHRGLDVDQPRNLAKSVTVE